MRCAPAASTFCRAIRHGHLSAKAGLGLAFAGITYHDGQGFMVMRSLTRPRRSKLRAPRSASRPARQASSISPISFAPIDDVRGARLSRAAPRRSSAFQSGQCNVLTRDHSALYAERLKLPRPADAVILPDIISKEPLGPVTRGGRLRLVQHRQMGELRARERGGTRDHVGERRAKRSPRASPTCVASSVPKGASARCSGSMTAGRSAPSGPSGNYSEIYERNLGVKSRLGIPRGLNQLWNMGGILYAPPLR